MAEAVLAGLSALYLLVVLVRVWLAGAVLRRSAPRHPADVRGTPTVLQAIRSGDPLMPGLLRENLANNPGVHFVWLVDEDDPAGQRAAESVAAELATDGRTGRVEIVVTPPLPPRRNPKVFKLVLGLPRCGDLVAVLDDDTVLPAGALRRAVAALADGDLVTGVPVYREQGTIWSRLVAAFVNGNALCTYLSVLRFTRPVTINGMFYVTRRDTLESLGGFAAIEDRLCDDYELAKLYRAGGATIVQSTVTHPLATTVPGAGAYLRIMRRWMVFAQQVLVTDLRFPVACLVVPPVVLPAAIVVSAAVTASPVWCVAALLVLLGKAVATGALRGRAGPSSVRGVLLEVVADVLLPVHVVAALIRPHRITWRDRVIDTRAGDVAVREEPP